MNPRETSFQGIGGAVIASLTPKQQRWGHPEQLLPPTPPRAPQKLWLVRLTGRGELGDKSDRRWWPVKGAYGSIPTLMPHLSAVEDRKELFTTGVVSNLQPRVAPGQAAEMDSWHWAHEWRGRRTETERERQPETMRESEIQLVRRQEEEEETGREILTSRFIRILMMPVREQYKAKETDIRPEADGGERSIGVARMGDVRRGGRAETGAGLGQKAGSGMSLLGPTGKPTGTLRRPRRGPCRRSCPSLRGQAQPVPQSRESMGGRGEGKEFWKIWGSVFSGPQEVKKRERRGLLSP